MKKEVKSSGVGLVIKWPRSPSHSTKVHAAITTIHLSPSSVTFCKHVLQLDIAASVRSVPITVKRKNVVSTFKCLPLVTNIERSNIFIRFEQPNCQFENFTQIVTHYMTATGLRGLH